MSATTAPRAEQLADYIQAELGGDIGKSVAAKMKEATARAREANAREGITDLANVSEKRVSDSGVTRTRRKEFAQKWRKSGSSVADVEETTVGTFLRAAGIASKNWTGDNFRGALKGVDPSNTLAELCKSYNDECARNQTHNRKALGETTFIEGGAIVPPQFLDEIIEYLRAKVVVRALGARVVPMARGTLTMPFAATGIVATATIENTATPTSQPQFGQLTLTAKKLRAVTPISNDLLADASPEADQFVQQDMVAAIRVLEDYNFLRGSGYAGNMRGLRNLANTNLLARNASGVAGGSTTSEIIADLMSILSSVEQGNITIENGGWVFAPRVKNALMSLRDGIGNFYFKAEMLQGTLWGHNFGSTTAQPINLDTTSGALSGKESEILFSDFDKVIIGDTQELVIEPFRGGAYYDSTTQQIVSGISNDQTVVVGQTRSDINERYRGAATVNLSRVTWGA